MRININIMKRMVLHSAIICFFFANAIIGNCNSIIQNNEPDSITKASKVNYLRFDDRIILSASNFTYSKNFDLIDNNSSNHYSTPLGAWLYGWVATLQYARIKLSYAHVNDASSGDYIRVHTGGRTYSIAYGIPKLSLIFRYEKYIRSATASTYYSDFSSIMFEEPSLEAKYTIFGKNYVNQLTAVNYIQCKSAGTFYIDVQPYQRTFYTSDTMILKEDFNNFPEIARARKVIQIGSMLKLGVEGNWVLWKTVYLAGAIQGGINPVRSTIQSFDGIKRKANSFEPIYSVSIGCGLNIKKALFFKISYDFDNILYSSPSATFRDNRKLTYLTLGYRFHEPGFMKRTREHIAEKAKSIF